MSDEVKKEKTKEQVIAEELVLISAMVNDIMEYVSIPYNQIYKVQELIKRTNAVLENANAQFEEKEEGESEKAN